MKFRRTFTLVSWAFVFIGAATWCVAAGEVLLLPIVVFLFAASYRKELRGKGFLEKKTQTFLSFAFLSVVLFEGLVLGGNWLSGFAHYLMALLVVKLFSQKEDRDFIQIYLLGFMLLASSAVVTIGMFFSVSFIFYMITGIWTLVMFQMKRAADHAASLENPDAKDSEKEYPENLVGGSFFMGTSSLAMITLFITVIIFLSIPRIGANLLGSGGGSKQLISGFSDSLGFTDFGRIVENPEVVLRVIVERGTVPPSGMYMRGHTYTFYDGVRWQRKREGGTTWTRTLKPETGLGTRSFTLRPFRPNAPDVLVQRVYRSPLNSRALFGVKEAVKFEFFGKNAPARLEVDERGNVMCPVEPGGTQGYLVYSKVFSNYGLLTTARVPTYMQRSLDYSFLPRIPEYPDWGRRISILGNRIVRNSGAKTDYEKVLAIQSYLKSNYSYSLNFDFAKNREVIEQFLFERKKGHCELFASAMVMLCRSARIPARVVTGFKGGEYNNVGSGHYVFKQKHAHAWVEVYLDTDDYAGNGNPIGWVTFDPTPPARAPRTSSIWEYMELKWIDWVISYSYSDQEETARSIGEGVGGLWNDAKNAFKSFIMSLACLGDPDCLARNAAVGMVLLALLFFYLYWWRKKRKAAVEEDISRSARSDPSLWFYVDFEKIMARRGFTRKITSTPLEFLGEIWYDSHISFAEAELLTKVFNRARYSPKAVDEQDRKKIKKSLKKLKRQAITADK